MPRAAPGQSDASGNAFVAGRTESPNFPTTAGVFDDSYNGGRDAFLTKVIPTGKNVAFSTFVGGGGEDETGGVILDADGMPVVTGWTTSPDFPTTLRSCQPRSGGNYDAYVYRLSVAGDRLLFGSYHGGMYPDYGRGIGIDATGSVHVGGYESAATTDLFSFRLP